MVLNGRFPSPLIGGTFSEPVKRWPDVFGNLKLFRSYPYLLPCIVVSLVPMLAFLLAFISLKEVRSILLSSYQKLTRLTFVVRRCRLQ